VEGTDPQPDCSDHGIVAALPVVVALMSSPQSGWYWYLPLHYSILLAMHLVTHFKVNGSTVLRPPMGDLYTYNSFIVYTL